MKHKPLIMITAVILIFVGCSPWEGVSRLLSFDREVSHGDFMCLTEGLISQGYNATYEPTKQLVFYDLKHPDFVGTHYIKFGSFKRDKEGKLIASDKIGHGAMTSCINAKPVGEILVSIENKILPICNLALIKKPRQKIKCR